MTTSPKRTFIGWTNAILQAATERLFAQHAHEGTWDLRRWLIVLPSSLAARRLQELLALRAEQADCVLYPPEIVTVGKLPEHLYKAKFPFASDMVQVLAWCRALQQIDPQQLENVLPLPPRTGFAQQWLELGKMLSGVHRELASDQLDFKGVVRALGGHPEAARWRALAAVQQRYLDVLDSLELWDIQTARLVALERGEPTTDKELLMLSTVDLNRAQRGFLAAVAQNVHIWVAAPPEMADRFDEFGCVIGEAWEDESLALPTDALLVGNSPTDQFELTAACLVELGERTHARNITLGVPDSTLIPLLEQHLTIAGAEVRFGPGTPLAQSEPALLLQLVGNYLEHRNYVDFAALVRHPVICRMVQQYLPEVGDSWLADIDRYYTDVLPRTVEPWVSASARGATTYVKVVELIGKWLEPLTVAGRTLDEWCQPLLDLFQFAYQQRNCNCEQADDERLMWACRCVTDQIVALADIPEALTLPMNPAEVIDWLMHAMNGQLVPRPGTKSAIEMLGWLDLTLDDAPVLIITGIHDGVVPECVNADPFLPNQLRRQLGMIDNARRYARDMYAFQVMLHSRSHVRVVVGRTNLAGDPLVPSRLLLACDLAELPARVLRLTADENLDVLPEVPKRWQAVEQRSVLDAQIDALEQSPSPALKADPPSTRRMTDSDTHSVFTIPAPNSSLIPKHITVTAFRAYLTCPYRFYLKHVCGLKNIDDLDAELSAGQFGDLIHETLRRMHLDPVGQCSDAAAIEIFLRETVEQVAAEKYGPHPAAAIRVQIAGAQDRLAAFAIKQAEHIAAGWITKHFEVEAVLEVGQMFGGKPLPIRLLGRIDRVDFHPATGQWTIWDYKTSDSGTKPIPNHFSSKTGWFDLQLPLYRHIVRALGIESEPQVGYILIPKSAKEIGFVSANFSAAQLQEADAEALRVIECVAAGRYEPRTLTPVSYDDFARVCLVGAQQTAPPKPPRHVHDHRRSAIASQRAHPQTVSQASQRIIDDEYIPRRSSVAPPLLPMMIRASAGTGKTYQLSNRLLQIILSGQSVDHVLATTFTRKAAGEILQRVLVRLAKACIHDRAFDDLQNALSGLPFDQADCLAALRRVTRQLHRFRVSTLDSFYAQIARTFSLELHLAPGWSAIDPAREAAVRMQAIQRMLDLSDQRTLTSLVKLLAKGDTKRSVAAEIEETVQGGYQYYRSADEKAFTDLRIPASPPEADFLEAIEFLERYDPRHKSIRNKQECIALHATIGAWEEVTSNGLMKAAVETQRYYSRELSSKLLDRLAVIRRKCAAELLPVRRAQSGAAYELLHSFNAEYMALLRRQRMLAFTDITYLLSRWMNPDRVGSQTSAQDLPLIAIDQQQLKLRMDCGIDHLLLDEFQDTAPDQWHIIEPLAKPLTEDITPSQSFFCVGDTKQAIYGWRGGVAEIFDTVTQSVTNLKESQLSQSYRSSPEVIDVVNAVFQYLPRHENFAECDKVAAHWSNCFPTHQTTRSELPGYVLVKNGIICDVDLPKEEKELAELEYSAKMIAELARNATHQSIGVLFRENRKVAIMIELLRQLGLSASQEGGNPLTDSAAVQLVLSLVHLADHPGDSIAAFHVQNSRLMRHLPEHVRHGSSALAEWVWQQVTGRGLGGAISMICDFLAPGLSWLEQHRLTQLITLAYQFETQFTHRLRDFEAFVQQQKVALPSEAQVKVMTIHSSKGLEFDAVFLPDLGIPLAGHPPLMVARAPDPCQPPSGILRHMNEHVQTLLPAEWREAFHHRKSQSVREILCVLYVAMTRARNALYMITAPRTSRKQNSTQHCESVLQSILGSVEQWKTAEAVLYERGNAAWYEQPGMSSMPARAGSSAKPDDSVVPFQIHGKAPVNSTQPQDNNVADVRAIALDVDTQRAPRRGFRIAAPSTIAALSSVPLDELFTVNGSLGIAVGTLVHACFEQIQWLDDKESVEVQKLRQAAVKALTPEQLRHVVLEKELANFLKLLELASIQKALSRSRYESARSGLVADEIVVENERRVSLILDDRLIDGSIDRLVVLKKGGRAFAAEIMDYKTDHWDTRTALDQWVRERTTHHRPQLKAYAQVASRMLKLPLERIDTSLVLLAADTVVRCDDHAPPPPHLKYTQLHLAW